MYTLLQILSFYIYMYTNLNKNASPSIKKELLKLQLQAWTHEMDQNKMFAMSVKKSLSSQNHHFRVNASDAVWEKRGLMSNKEARYQRKTAQCHEQRLCNFQYPIIGN